MRASDRSMPAVRRYEWVWLLVAAALIALSTQAAEPRPNGRPLSLNGAGATFPYPLYSKWFSDYRQVDPGLELNYQSIGSGGGIRQLLERTIDFGASDVPMNDEQIAKATAPILHVPTVLGAIALTYNLPGFTSELRLDAATLSALFRGKIFYWNDARIAALNPGAKLPDVPVMIVHRADGSGTTAVFTDYLAKADAAWKAEVGAGASIKWPVGLGGKGNEGVTGFVKNSPGALGYIELLYAEKNHLPAARLANARGEFVAPSVGSVLAAAKGAVKAVPADFRMSVTNADGPGAYPIASFTYLLVYRKMGAVKSAKLKTFLEWALGEGQSRAAPLFYAPLPAELAKRVVAAVRTLE